MKIGILTQPLHNNYGGLLQAFALQTVLKKMGHEAWTMDMRMMESEKDFRFYLRLIRSIVRILIKYYLFQKQIALDIWLTEKFKHIVSKHTQRFINENICTTLKINFTDNLSLLTSYCFEAYIVGSDQVWRPEYSSGLTRFFLDFLNDNNSARRIAYAASFGVENWEFTPEQTEVCSILAKKFNAISVREDSAVHLCKKHLGVFSIHVLDPTLLLSKEDYIALVKKDNIPASKGTLITYILDPSSDNEKIVTKVSEIFSLNPFAINKSNNTKKNVINDYVFPPVTQWLRGFVDAEFVITDSFHGTVFSILFNKPFIAIGNKNRGLARFTSLVKIFGLENRVVNSSQEITEKLLKEAIDWDYVNAVLSERKAEAIQFLKDALKQD
jgi:polysaccharide pyruvyl transferase WcaK-like protein